jgi:hypothetical protein
VVKPLTKVLAALVLLLIPATGVCQLERYDGTILSPKGTGVPGATVAICSPSSINVSTQPCSPLSSLYSWNIVAATGAARAANQVTITTTQPHGLAIGAAIAIAGVSDATFNGSFTVASVPSSTTFIYLQNGANSTSGSGTVSGQNPITSDAFGNYFFFGLSGQYVIQIFSSQLSQQFVQYGVTLPCDAVTNCGSNTNNTWTGSNTFTSPVTLLGTPSLQSTGNGTQLSVQAANGASGNTFGGLISLGTGNGIGSGNGGAFNVSLGNGGASNGVGGSVTISAGAGGGTGAGGNINLTPGTGTPNGIVQVNGTFKGTSQVSAKRYDSDQASALVSGDFAISAGWGGSAIKSGVLGTDQSGKIDIQANGTTSGNPTVILTFHDGAWTKTPNCVVSRGDGNAPATGFWIINNASSSTTVLQMQFVGTPTSGNVYTVNFSCMGT